MIRDQIKRQSFRAAFTYRSTIDLCIEEGQYYVAEFNDIGTVRLSMMYATLEGAEAKFNQVVDNATRRQALNERTEAMKVASRNYIAG